MMFEYFALSRVATPVLIPSIVEHPSTPKPIQYSDKNSLVKPKSIKELIKANFKAFCSIAISLYNICKKSYRTHVVIDGCTNVHNQTRTFG